MVMESTPSHFQGKRENHIKEKGTKRDNFLARYAVLDFTVTLFYNLTQCSFHVYAGAEV